MNSDLTLRVGEDSRGHRDRIYDKYVYSRNEPLAPGTLDGLGPRAAYLQKLVRDHFPLDRSSSILDLGCGHGALLFFGQQAGYYNMKGVDLSLEQVIAAKRLGISGVSYGDLRESLSAMKDASFDVFVAFDVIEHFTKDELMPFVHEVWRVLRPQGRWLIHAPNGESPFCARVRYGDFTHEIAFTRESITQLLLVCGFASVKCFEDAPICHGVKSAVRWVLWKIIRTGIRLRLAIETGDTGRSAIFTQNLLAVAYK